MNKTIRSGVLLSALLAMVVSSVGGCASSAVATGKTAPWDISHPSPDILKKIPAETFVRIELLSGKIVEGIFLSYAPDVASVQFSMEHVDNALSSEFKDEGRVYRIPEEKIVKLTVLEQPKNSKALTWIVGVSVVIVGTVWLLFHGMHEADI